MNTMETTTATADAPDTGATPAGTECGGKKKKSAARENVEAIFIAVLIALFVRAFIVQAFKIPSASMVPTLLIGDQILVNKFIYGVRLPFTNTLLIPVSKPKRWDIVVFRYPENRKIDYIKRVVATGGETLEIRQKEIFINGKKVEDPYGVWDGISPPDGANFGPVTVPPGHYFVMGDNRNHSHDSRYWRTCSFVGTEDLRGKAFVVYFSKEDSLIDVRWNRLGHVLR
jgi:signal peptidase I